MSRTHCGSRVLAALLLAWPGAMQAQASHSHPGSRHGDASPADSTARASTDAAMSGSLHAGLHLTLSPSRTPTAADSARAGELLATIRESIETYRDVRVAEADGYRQFAPGVKQSVYHFTKWGHAIRAEFRFDVTRPTSLLYREDNDGRLELVGAMYTAPARSSPEDLDERVPLGIARWHLHTNICVPQRMRDRDAWQRMEDGAPVFGPASPIATEVECRAVGGRFNDHLFNWMVHVNVFERDPWALEHDGPGGAHGH